MSCRHLVSMHIEPCSTLICMSNMYRCALKTVSLSISIKDHNFMFIIKFIKQILTLSVDGLDQDIN